MTATRESLQESFKLLDDEDLLSQFQSGELTSLAQEVARLELRRRGVDLAELKVEARGQERGEQQIEIEDGDLVQIARFLNPMEAEILRGRLEAEGVLAIVADANLAQVNSLLAPVIGGVRILVLASHLERARDIVKAIERGDYQLKDEAGTDPLR